MNAFRQLQARDLSSVLGVVNCLSCVHGKILTAKQNNSCRSAVRERMYPKITYFFIPHLCTNENF